MGIRFRHQSSKTPYKYLVETMGGGCAFVDYDSDGWLDVLMLNGAPLPGGRVEGRPMMALYRNDRGRAFTDVTKQVGLDEPIMYAMGAAVGDYDNDGFDDLYVSAVLGLGRLFHNEAGKRFRDITTSAGVGNPGMWGTSCAWLDYDKDGRLDLFICNYVKYRSLRDDLPCYASTGKKRVYCIPSAYESSPPRLYRNVGGGRFQDVSASSGVASAKAKGLGVTVFDYDGDSWPDIFVASDTVAGLVFHNEGNGTFTERGLETGVGLDEAGTPHAGMGIAAGDLHNDGVNWLGITNYQGQQTSMYRQISPHLFRDDRHATGVGDVTAKVLGFGLLFFDYDNDGYKDIFQVNGHVQDEIQEREPAISYPQPTLAFHNGRNGTFQEAGLSGGAPFTNKIVGRGLATGDYDNDGQLDVLIATNNGPACLWRNGSGGTNQWLKLKLVGKRSNRNGIGATVLVTVGGATQKQVVASGSSYLSASDLRPNFGLASQTVVDVEVRWPSGVVDRLPAVKAGQVVTVTEGSYAK
jgi:enediyne biosynthesis protein E4